MHQHTQPAGGSGDVVRNLPGQAAATTIMTISSSDEALVANTVEALQCERPTRGMQRKAKILPAQIHNRGLLLLRVVTCVRAPARRPTGHSGRIPNFSECLATLPAATTARLTSKAPEKFPGSETSRRESEPVAQPRHNGQQTAGFAEPCCNTDERSRVRQRGDETPASDKTASHALILARAGHLRHRHTIADRQSASPILSLRRVLREPNPANRESFVCDIPDRGRVFATAFARPAYPLTPPSANPLGQFETLQHAAFRQEHRYGTGSVHMFRPERRRNRYTAPDRRWQLAGRTQSQNAKASYG